MSNITGDFSSCLEAKRGRALKYQQYDTSLINSFLAEAYSINTRIAELTRTLRSTRPRYLSTAQPTRRQYDAKHDRAAPLTNHEREAFDAASKHVIRGVNAAVNNLREAEDVRRQTAESVALARRAKNGLGALGRWAAGGAVTAKSPEEEVEEAERNTIAAFRESVIMFLQQRLDEATRIQSGMMELRLSRELEKAKSNLSQSGVGGNIMYARDVAVTPGKKMNHASANGYQETTSAHMPIELSQEQAQLFEQENSEMLQYYENQLDQVRKAESSILEISQLHNQLHANLQQQSEHIDQLVMDSFSTTENVGKGNVELKRASERQSTAQLVFYATVTFCSFLIVWDLAF